MSGYDWIFWCYWLVGVPLGIYWLLCAKRKHDSEYYRRRDQ